MGCLGPPETGATHTQVQEAWYQTTDPGKCAVSGNKQFTALDERRLMGIHPVFREYRPPAPQCYNSYLPWAVVTPNKSNESHNGSRCAYEFGAEHASAQGNWDSVEEILRHLKAKEETSDSARCWTLDSDDCIIAFREQSILAAYEKGRLGILRVGAEIFGGFALVFCMLAAKWYCDFYCGRVSGLGGYDHQALPTSEPDEEAQLSLISDRVRAIMEATSGWLHAEPPDTVRTGIDSPRTVEVVGADGKRSALSRNIAADFL